MFRKYRLLIALIVICAAIKIFSLFPLLVEHYYAHGAYPVLSIVQRVLLGWIPFSIGDVLYFLAGLWLIMQLVEVIRHIRKKQAGTGYFLAVGRRFLTGALVVYIIFNSFWGLNYNRTSIAEQLALRDNVAYTTGELVDITSMLVRKVNLLQPASLHTRTTLASNKVLFTGAVNSYGAVSQRLPLQYAVPSVKPSLYSYLGNYLGFTGYYNPFTGEAQVNTTVPLFVRPFTTCHEIGHQLGYAKESEANFAGFLSASASRDSSFLYSVYFDLFLYAARYLYVADSSALLRLRDSLAPGVLQDRLELSAFVQKYSTPVADVIDRLYSKYLQANQQPSGRMSYNEVVGFLIAYRNKYGKI